MNSLRMIFMGTAELACASLAALKDNESIEIAAVVTQPDRPRGRDLKLQPSPVKTLALEFGLPVLQPEKARNPEFVRQLAELQPELIIVAAYGQILPQAILDLPRFGCLNVHTSLLPKYRGAAPIQWAILDDEKETGVTIMKMDAGLDTGAIVVQASMPISDYDNAETLHDRLAEQGARVLLHNLPRYISGELKPEPQPVEGVSYARKISKQDGLIDWSLPGRPLWNRIRAFTPWPGAFTFLPADPKPRLLKLSQSRPIECVQEGAPGEILSADKSGIIIACGTGALQVNTLQLEGGKRLAVGEFLRGHKLKPGDRLGGQSQSGG